MSAGRVVTTRLEYRVPAPNVMDKHNTDTVAHIGLDPSGTWVLMVGGQSFATKATTKEDAARVLEAAGMAAVALDATQVAAAKAYNERLDRAVSALGPAEQTLPL